LRASKAKGGHHTQGGGKGLESSPHCRSGGDGETTGGPEGKSKTNKQRKDRCTAFPGVFVKKDAGGLYTEVPPGSQPYYLPLGHLLLPLWVGEKAKWRGDILILFIFLFFYFCFLVGLLLIFLLFPICQGLGLKQGKSQSFCGVHRIE